MNKNQIDIKIREFVLYLNDFGLLNEENIKDFLKIFGNINKNDQLSVLNNYDKELNLNLIYLKENLIETMFEFFNLMTEERKRMIYLNIYFNFLKKREEDLHNKGFLLFNTYTSLIKKKYFFRWKSSIFQNNNKRKNTNKLNNGEDSSLLRSFENLKADNFSFEILSDDCDINGNNLIINSNNHKIIFNKNICRKNDMRSTFNSYNDINTLRLSTTSTNFNSKNSKKKFYQSNNPIKSCNFQTIENNDNKMILYEDFNNKMMDDKKQSFSKSLNVSKSQLIKRRKNSKGNDIKNYQKYINNKLLKTEKLCFNDNLSDTNNKNYDTKKNIIQERKQKFKENLIEIKEKSNHPINKKNLLHNSKNAKNTFHNDKSNNNSKIKKKKISLIENMNRKSYNQNANLATLKNKCAGNILSENQRKYIELYEEIIMKEEKKLENKFISMEKEKC